MLLLKAEVRLVMLGAALASCGHNLPSKLDDLPKSLSQSNLKTSGFYPDAWVADSASIQLEQPGGPEVLSVRGMVPQISDARFRSDLELRVADRRVAHWDLGVGDFALSAPVAAGAGERRVTLVFGRTQQLPGGDGRFVGARLSFIGFEPKSAAAAEQNSADIVRGTQVQLGTGWGVLETFHGETFRWVDNDAEISLVADRPGKFEISVVAEPGPGVGSKPFLLKILDAEGREVSAKPVEKRDTVRLILPVAGGRTNQFRLHVDGGGKTVPTDPRVLNFRVFELAAQESKSS